MITIVCVYMSALSHPHSQCKQSQNETHWLYFDLTGSEGWAVLLHITALHTNCRHRTGECIAHMKHLASFPSPCTTAVVSA